MANERIFRVRLIRGPSAAQWKKWGLKTVPYALPAFLLNIFLINWQSLPEFLYDYFTIIFVATVLFFMLPLFMFAFRQKWELRNGYCTLPYEALTFKATLESFVFVDDQTGIILARCDQLPITGEGLAELKVQAQNLDRVVDKIIELVIPKYQWKITSASFDWAEITRPLYFDYLSRDSAPGAGEAIKLIRLLETGD